MKLISRLLLRNFVPVFLLSLAFFVLIIQLVDLFANLIRYLNLDIPIGEIFRVQILFLPKSVSYALPVALLFAVAYTLGAFYANNELVAVFGAGVSLGRFVFPTLAIGLFFSAGMFFFQEHVVIDTFREKNELSRRLLNITRTFSNTDVTIRAPGGEQIYSVEYYNDTTRELSRVMVLTRDREGRFVKRIDAASGRWNGEHWVWEQGTRFVAEPSENEGPTIVAEPFREYTSQVYRLPPDTFRRSGLNVDEMSWQDAGEWIQALRNTGQPYRQVLTDYYSRFSLALTPFVVVLLSSSFGGRFRKNILLMSLLVSLIGAVVYYVTGMVAGLMAGRGLIPPALGAWIGVVLFTVLGLLLLRTART